MSSPEQPSQAPHDPVQGADQPSGPSTQAGAGFQAGPGYQAGPGFQAPQPGPAGYQYQAPGGPRSTDRFFDSVRRTGLVRTEQRWVGGVAGGLARRLDVDPVLVRCVWAVLCVFTGVGLIIYGLGWALVPEERDGRIHVQQALEGDVDAGLAGAITAVVAGVALSDHGILPGWFFDEGLGRLIVGLSWLGLNVAVVCLVVWAVARALQRRREHRQAQAAGMAAGPVPPYGPTAWQAPRPAAAPQAGAAPSSAPRPGPAPSAAQTQADAGPRPVYTYAPVPAGASAPTTMPPAVPARPVQPVQPPRPPRPRVPGPGRTLSLIVLGLLLLALAVSILSVATGTLGVLGAGLVAAGAVVGLLGLGVSVSALRGRRGGWMTGFGWLAALAAVPALALGTALPPGSVSGTVELRPVVYTVTDSMLQAAAQSSDKVLNLGSYGAAAVTVDLTELDDGPYPVERIKVTTGAGMVRVLTKQTQSVQVNAATNLGEVYGRVPGSWTVQGAVATQTTTSWPSAYDLSGKEVLGTFIYADDPFGVRATLSSEKAAEDEPALTVDATVGLGGVQVREQRSGSVSWSGFKMGDYWIVDSWTDANGKEHAADDLPVPGMTHQVVSAEQANQCLTQAKALSAKEHSSQDEEDLTPSEDSDEWIWLDSLSELSSTAKTAMADCLDQVLATGAVPKADSAAATSPSAAPSPSAEAGSAATESAQPAA
nr:PspC domain-containing protein [Actinomyces sp.]